MLTQLAHLLADPEDSLTIILTKSGDGLSLTVIPKTKGVPHERTVPLSLRGPLEELEVGLVQALTTYAGGHLSIAEQVALAAKAQQAQANEAAAKAKEKAAAKAKGAASAAATPGAKTEAQKVEPPAPPAPPSLWDEEDGEPAEFTQAA